ncbi:MAG: ECF-type sigma factor [Burkholderiaceae bacterium]
MRARRRFGAKKPWGWTWPPRWHKIARQWQPGHELGSTDSADSSGIAVDAMFEATYRELRQLAHSRLRGGGRNIVLDTTALVHESYLRLSKSNELLFPDRTRFLVYASRVMRSIIIDMVRQRQTDRHGADAQHLTLTGDVAERLGLATDEVYILRVHEALAELEKVDERMARVVEMRYFGGLTDAEVAAALQVTDRTVRRDWQQARLFLAEALK